MSSGASVTPGRPWDKPAQRPLQLILDVSYTSGHHNSTFHALKFLRTHCLMMLSPTPTKTHCPDLNKEFEVPPYSQSVTLGSQVELRCHPPNGQPRPRVSND